MATHCHELDLDHRWTEDGAYCTSCGLVPARTRRRIGGTVYLLHFTKPYVSQSGAGTKVARHYLGATGLPLEERLAAHRGLREYAGDLSYGRPARLLQAVLAAGGDWIVADVWETATRAEAFQLEKAIKSHHNSTAYCSICNPGNVRGTRAERFKLAIAHESQSGMTTAGGEGGKGQPTTP